MKIVTNEKLVKRNKRIAQAATISGLIVLVGGMILSFQRQDLINISFASLIAGFILSQVGIYFTTRFGRSPRPDEMLNLALKGLDSKYAIYHYLTPAAHLLVGPAGLWVFMLRHQRGTISLSKGRWKHSGGGFMQTYLKLFGQESLGRPDLEIENEIEKLNKFMKPWFSEELEAPRIQGALVFTNDEVNIKIDTDETPPAPTLSLKQLKDFMRKTAKTKSVSSEKIEMVQELLNGKE